MLPKQYFWVFQPSISTFMTLDNSHSAILYAKISELYTSRNCACLFQSYHIHLSEAVEKSDPKLEVVSNLMERVIQYDYQIRSNWICAIQLYQSESDGAGMIPFNVLPKIILTL